MFSINSCIKTNTYLVVALEEKHRLRQSLITQQIVEAMKDFLAAVWT
jgi:hypothetical protein